MYGQAGPDQGIAQIALNGEIVNSMLNMSVSLGLSTNKGSLLNIQAPWDLPNTLLWMRTGLNSSQRTNVTLTTLSERKISLDYVLFTASPAVQAQL